MATINLEGVGMGVVTGNKTILSETDMMLDSLASYLISILLVETYNIKTNKTSHSGRRRSKPRKLQIR